jgi:hypothetical protein
MKPGQFSGIALALAVALTTASLVTTVADSTAEFVRATMGARQSQGFSSFVPGATRHWCDSLPYPYCANPAPGVPNSGAPMPGAHPMTPHPIFGE